MAVQVVGLGFVGLTFAAFLSRFSEVIGVEISEDKRKLVAEGKAPFFEPGLDMALGQAISAGRLKVLPEPVPSNEKNVFVITVGTPIQGGNVDLNYLDGVVREVATVARNKDLVIVRSTVSIGTTRKLVYERFRSFGLNVFVAMCPERTIEGTALRELEELPQIVGGIDDSSTNEAVRFFQDHGIQTIEVDSAEAAELSKLAANTYRDLQFAFGNELATLGDAHGINVRQVIEATNRGYSRSNIAFPGPAAGPCLEKDPWILVRSGEEAGVDMRISRASREMNELVVDIAVDDFLRQFKAKGQCRFLLAGLAFKGTPETDDTRGSLALPMLDKLSFHNAEHELFAYDPIANELPPRLRGRVTYLSSLDDCKTRFDGLIVQHSGKKLHQGLEKAAHLFEDAWILDFWGNFERTNRSKLDESKVLVFGGRHG